MNQSPVVILGPARDAHVVAMIERVRAAGAPVVPLDAAELSTGRTLVLGDDEVFLDHRPLRPACVYVRDVGAAHPVVGAMLARWDEAEIPVYNAPRRTGRGTARLTPCRDRSAARPRLRVYLLDGHVVAAVAIGERDPAEHDRIDPAFLSDAVVALCRGAAELVGLRFTYVDVERDARGADGVVAIAPCPTFVELDEAAGTDIATKLAARLAGWASRFPLYPRARRPTPGVVAR